MRKRWWIIAAVVVTAAGLGYVGYGALQRDTQRVMAASATETAVVKLGTIQVSVDGSGSLAPYDEVTLAFSASGEVAEVKVEVGDVAESGDVLARLDDADAREAVADAELQVAQAEISLALRQAEVELGLAQANLDAAQASYAEAAALANRTGDQLTSTRVSLAQAEDALEDAQADYDDAWGPGREWEQYNKFTKDRWEADREATEKALERAQYDLEVAQADYNLAVAGISEANVQNAWTQVLNAQVALETEPLQLEQLEASLSLAEIRLESARRALEDTKLIAPMDGTVTVLNVKVGERASAGQAAVVLSDLRTFVVEVNLDEVDVAKVSVGQEAVVTLDAFPDEELAGEVTDIAPVANVQSGVVLYPVTVQLSPAEMPARAGMTANVEIVTVSKADALIIPLRAIQSESDKSYVWRQSTDGFEKAEVTLGVMTEVEVEIASGLSEGDVVSVVASPAQGGGQPGWGPGGMFGGGGDD
jgi:HlyD family secretion protein